MPWVSYEFEAQGRPAAALLDTQFTDKAPTDQLPNLAWFGVYHQQPRRGSWWRPSEGPKLDAIEQDLIKLCGAFGNGWAVYVRRLQTPGVTEYYVYFGNGAELHKVLPSLKAQHSKYRIEFESRPDPEWSQYKGWVKENAGHG
jgi:hypothetical protein